MNDPRRTLRAIGLALIALGAVSFMLGLVAYWLNVLLPIDLGMPIGSLLTLAGLILALAPRSRRVPDRRDHLPR